MLEQKADPNYMVGTVYPLLYVVGTRAQHQIEIINTLIAFGAAPNGPDGRLLHRLAFESRGVLSRRPILMNALLERGADTEERPASRKVTLLMDLCVDNTQSYDQREQMIKTLLRFDVRLNIKTDQTTVSPLELAARRAGDGKMRIFDLILHDKRLKSTNIGAALLSVGVDVDPLVFEKLVAMKPDLMMRDAKTGSNILMKLCHETKSTNRNVHKVKILLANLTQWQITLQNSKDGNRTAIETAADMDRVDLIDLIRTRCHDLSNDDLFQGHP